MCVFSLILNGLEIVLATNNRQTVGRMDWRRKGWTDRLIGRCKWISTIFLIYNTHRTENREKRTSVYIVQCTCRKDWSRVNWIELNNLFQLVCPFSIFYTLHIRLSLYIIFYLCYSEDSSIRFLSVLFSSFVHCTLLLVACCTGWWLMFKSQLFNCRCRMSNVESLNFFSRTRDRDTLRQRMRKRERVRDGMERCGQDETEERGNSRECSFPQYSILHIHVHVSITYLFICLCSVQYCVILGCWTVGQRMKKKLVVLLLLFYYHLVR